MTWYPLRVLIATIIYLRGVVKREDIRDVDVLSGHDHFFDQALCDCLAIGKRQAVQIVAEQVAKVVDMGDDVVPVQGLLVGLGELVQFSIELLEFRRQFLPPEL